MMIDLPGPDITKGPLKLLEFAYFLLLYCRVSTERRKNVAVIIASICPFPFPSISYMERVS